MTGPGRTALWADNKVYIPLARFAERHTRVKLWLGLAGAVGGAFAFAALERVLNNFGTDWGAFEVHPEVMVGAAAAGAVFGGATALNYARRFANRFGLALGRDENMRLRKSLMDAEQIVRRLTIEQRTLSSQNVILQNSLQMQRVVTIDDKTPFDGKNIFKGVIGIGGMAIALKVFDTRLEKSFVFKVPLPNLLADGAELERFTGAEAKSMVELNHPGVVRFFSLEEMNRSIYETLTGHSLAGLKKHRVAKCEFLKIGEEVDELWLDLIKNGYINSETGVIFDRFNKITSEEEMGLDARFSAKRKAIYGILKNLPSEIPYISMEFVDSPTLEEELRGAGRFLLERAISISISLAGTLQFVHENGIIHRDLKLSNIFLIKDKKDPRKESTKIADFGLAKTVGVSAGTIASTAMGTPDNMSPEQWKGLPDIDWRTDQYAAGVILYEMLSGGEPPFGRVGNDLMAYGLRVTNEEVSQKIMGKISIREPRANKLWLVLKRMLARERENRYQNWEECIRVFQSIDVSERLAAKGPVSSKTQIGPFIKK